jgi:Restriction endonuclease BamHI
MNFVQGYSHRNGKVEWEKRELDEWITDVFNAPSTTLEAHATSAIRSHVRSELTNQGWSDEVPIAPNFTGVTIFSQKDDLAIQIQTGNVSRVFYDLVKLQYLFIRNKIEAAALAVPTKTGAQLLGSNIANFERLCAELQLYDRVITVPILVIAFE